MAQVIDALLQEIADRGWFVYSLRQGPTGWSCHLRDTIEGTSTRVLFGHGPDAGRALQHAMEATAYEQIIEPVTIAQPPSLTAMIPQTHGKVYRR